jgi:hypothetical protein
VIAELQGERRYVAAGHRERSLNDRGSPTACGGKWFAASVRDVLARI